RGDIDPKYAHTQRSLCRSGWSTRQQTAEPCQGEPDETGFDETHGCLPRLGFRDARLHDEAGQRAAKGNNTDADPQRQEGRASQTGNEDDQTTDAAQDTAFCRGLIGRRVGSHGRASPSPSREAPTPQSIGSLRSLSCQVLVFVGGNVSTG